MQLGSGLSIATVLRDTLNKLCSISAGILIIVENGADPDQIVNLQKPVDLDLQCFQKRMNPDLAGQSFITAVCMFCLVQHLHIQMDLRLLTKIPLQ